MLANSKNPQFVAVVEPGALGTEIELLVKYGGELTDSVEAESLLTRPTELSALTTLQTRRRQVLLGRC